MTSSESLRGVRPAGRETAASERARRPRADRIEVDFSWSDQDDFGWSEPSSRSGSRRATVRAERPGGDRLPEGLPASSSPATGVVRAPQPIAAPEQRIGAAAEPIGAAAESTIDAVPAVALDSTAALGGALSGVRATSFEAVPAARRTVVIRGQGTRGYAPSRGGYEARLRLHERSGFKPDRVALWAVLLGLALLLGAVTSSHAATLHDLLLNHALIHHAP